MIVTKRTLLSQEDWIKAGKPDMLMKVKKLPNGVVYDNIAYGGIVFIANNKRLYTGKDILRFGKMLVIGPYFTGKKTEVYWKHQG